MDTASKAVVTVVCGALILAGLCIAIYWNARYITVSDSALIPAATSTEATAAPSLPPNMLDSVGTIVFYIQQGVEVPYFFYLEHGDVHAKALAFEADTICVTSVEAPCTGGIDSLKQHYGSGPVRIRGMVADETLWVSHIAPAP